MPVCIRAGAAAAASHMGRGLPLVKIPHTSRHNSLKTSDGNRCLSFHARGGRAATPYKPIPRTLEAAIIAALPRLIVSAL